ncbi:membrane-targeted effector domain-containing toxin [Burkholderia latens]|uniref:membrane-targeted effector domain-containing toxin n=1 Tax=Burkholderia latens TaxID=488446 RepID=UPI00158EF9CF|nr:membrane-targeted effector domain-containing toxin [Burkholderia latens]
MDWINAFDPLIFPAAHARNLEEERNPRERLWKQQLQNQPNPEIYSSVQIDQTAESNSLPSSAEAGPASNDAILEQLVDEHIISRLQGARAHSAMHLLREKGELVGTLESCAYQHGEFIDEILNHRGLVAGITLLQCLPLGDPEKRSVDIVGLPPSVASILHEYYDASGAERMRMGNDLRDSANLPPVGTSLNVDEAWRTTQSALFQPTACSTDPTSAPPATSSSIVLRDMDTGIHRAVRLELLGEDGFWYPLHYSGDDNFSAAIPGAPSDVVTIDSTTGKARFMKGWDGHYDSLLDVQIRDESPFVTMHGDPRKIRRVCLGSDCFFNYLEIYGEAVMGNSHDNCPAYVNPLSRTWHPLIENDTPIHNRGEVGILELIAEPPQRNVIYGRPEHVDIEAGPRFRVIMPGNTDPLEQYEVVEMLGMLIPARKRLAQSNATLYEIFDRNDLLGECHPIKWNGLRWVFDCDATSSSLDYSSAQSKTQPPELMSATSLDLSAPAATPSSTTPEFPLYERHESSASVATDGTHRESEHADAAMDTPDASRILRRFFQIWSETFPDIFDLARSKLKAEIKARTGLDLDPDRVYFMRFDSAQSDPGTVTGWAHVGKPAEERVLTACLLTNFPASAVEHPWVVDQLSGIYSAKPTQAERFDGKNEVRIRPSQLMKIVRDIDFYEFARHQLQQAWCMMDLQAIQNSVVLASNLATPANNLSSTDASFVLRGVRYFDNKPRVDVYYFDINGYAATDMLVFQDTLSKHVVLYLPRSHHALFSFVNEHEMRQWVLDSCRVPNRRNDIARHFSLYDRQDGSSYSGVDTWLSTFAQTRRGSYLRNIFSRKTLITDRDIFRAMAERQKVRAFSDLDLAVKSDSEVDRDRAILYSDAFNTILPNPVTPFVSLGLHMDAAINGDTPEERVAGMAGALADTGNIAFMAVQAGIAGIFDGVIGVDSDAFHTTVRESLRTLSNTQTIEWNRGRWIANGDTSPRASKQLRRHVTLDMYASEVREAELTLPDQLGLRSAADGTRYLKIEGRYLQISKWGGAANRYFITGENGRKIALRFDAGKFRFETIGERLEILFHFGLGGKGSKLSFEREARAGDSRGPARGGSRGNAPAESPGAPPSDYFEPLSGVRHSTHRNGEAVYSTAQQDTLRRLSIPTSSSNTYKQVRNNNPAFYGNGKLYEVHGSEKSASLEPAYSVVEMNGHLIPARENVIEGHGSSYEIYDLSAADKPGLSIEWEGSRWIFEPPTSRQLSTDLLERLREVSPASIDARQLSSPDSIGLRWDDRNQAYVKIDGQYVALKQFLYHGEQQLYGVWSDNAPTMTYAAGAFRLLPGSDWTLAKVPLEVYSVPDEFETFVAMFDHWPSSTWRLRGGLRRADADPRFHKAIVLARRLKTDAATFFEQLRQTVRTAEPFLSESATDRQVLETLFKNKDGIVFGEQHDKTATVRALIENIQEFKRLGVKTLYIEGFFADFSGAELENYSSTPGAPMPEHTKQWADFLSIGEGLDPNGPYSKRELIRLAHANNIEIRPLDCVASYFGPFFGFFNREFFRTRLKMMNFFGAATIVQHRWTKGGGKWIALTGASHINVKYGIPGLAELTDSFGIRVKEAPRQTQSNISPGHTVHGNIDSHFDYVWLRPSTHYPTALRSGNARLWENAQAPLRQVQLDLYQIPDRAGWRDAMAEKVMEYRGLDQRYADLSASKKEQDLLQSFFRQRETLREDASQFFEDLPHGDPALGTVLPLAIDPVQPDSSILNALLSKNGGIVFGESHSHIEGKKMLVVNMSSLKSAGVKTLYLEHLLSDVHQVDIDAYLQTPDAIMSPKLRAYLDDMSAGNDIDPDGPYTYYTLIEQARRDHINVIALDCTASYKISDLLSDNPNARHQMMSYYASSTISQHQAALGNAKWVALVGNSHTNTFSGIPGIAELTNSIGVRVEPDDTLLRSKFLLDDGKEVWDIRHGKTSLRADYVWMRPSTQSAPEDL